MEAHKATAQQSQHCHQGECFFSLECFGLTIMGNEPLLDRVHVPLTEDFINSFVQT